LPDKALRARSFFGRQGASGVRPECNESGNQFSVDPILFRACAPTGGKGLNLHGRQLPRHDPGDVKRRPELPFLTAGCFKKIRARLSCAIQASYSWPFAVFEIRNR
jgi:hypothetical protein